ncbi:MAG: hypothetical protein LBL57_07865 [Tannerella sp.]|nr:hypothetical protein [Tannerella sp.]
MKQFDAVYVTRFGRAVFAIEKAALDLSEDAGVGFDFGIFDRIGVGGRLLVGDGQAELLAVFIGQGFVVAQVYVDEMPDGFRDVFGLFLAVKAVNAAGVSCVSRLNVNTDYENVNTDLPFANVYFRLKQAIRQKTGSNEQLFKTDGFRRFYFGDEERRGYHHEHGDG